MKKLATWLLVLCVGLFLFSGCGDGDTKKPGDKPADKKPATP